jgi:hypothetical protein
VPERDARATKQLIGDAVQQDDAMTDALVEAPVAGGGIAAETLRRVAEEVRAAFPRPLRAPELVLIDVDPRRVHAFWTLPAATIETARQGLGRDGAAAPMVLCIFEISASGSDGAAFDVEVVGLQGQCYVDIWDKHRRYRGELGLQRPDGGLVSLAGSATIELPPLGPPAEQRPSALEIAANQSERRDEQTPAPAPGEPVRHAFPLPPTEPSDFVPEHLAAHAAVGAEAERRQPALRPSEREAALPSAQPEPLASATQELPEPVRHPFPLPPTEASEFVPEVLIGGFLPPVMEASPENPRPAEQTAAAPPEQQHREPEPVVGDAPGEVRAPTEGGSGPLPLENVLTLSSYALGRETVEFEVNAELHIFGRARPGAQLQLFGRKVTLRPDGTFSISRPLPNGALVLSSLMVGDDGCDDR